MNKLHGHIHTIETGGSLSRVGVTMTPEQLLHVIVIDTPETAAYLTPSHPVKVLFKETAVIISSSPAKDLSIENAIPASVDRLEKGKLLSSVKLNSAMGSMEAIIPTTTCIAMGLRPGQKVTALVKLNDMMLAAE